MKKLNFSILPKTRILQTEHHSNRTWRSQLHSRTSPKFLHQRSSVHHASRYFQVVFVLQAFSFLSAKKCFPCRFGGLFVQSAWQWVSLLEIFWVEEALQSPQVFKVSFNSRDKLFLSSLRNFKIDTITYSIYITSHHMDIQMFHFYQFYLSTWSLPSVWKGNLDWTSCWCWWQFWQIFCYYMCYQKVKRAWYQSF